MKSSAAIAIFLLLLIASTQVTAQRKDMSSKRQYDMFGRDLFVYRYFNFADSTDSSLSRIEFHVAVVNDLLTFVKEDKNTFKARYEVAVIIMNDDEEPLFEKSLTERVTTKVYAETNSRRNARQHKISASLKPGKYKALLQLIDIESNEVLTKKLTLRLKDFSPEKLNLSDIIFLDRIDTTNQTRHYEPNLSHVFDDINSAFSAYLEIYLPKSLKEAQASTAIVDSKGNKIHSSQYVLQNQGRINPMIIPFRQYLREPGEYTLIVSVQAGEEKAKTQRMFSVIWGSMPLANNNLEMAIDQLALVAHKEDIEAMRNARGAERKRLYDAYWKERDPTPMTEKNELQIEFFRRVDFANRHFTEISSGRSGWQTDRGRIYIVYGPPDEVSHSDSEIRMPTTEIWYYNRLGRKYYFADRTGEGVYRLIKVE